VKGTARSWPLTKCIAVNVRVFTIDTVNLGGGREQAKGRSGLVPERMLSWYPNSTLHCTLLMQASKY
jgi:hypothetical protein